MAEPSLDRAQVHNVACAVSTPEERQFPDPPIEGESRFCLQVFLRSHHPIVTYECALLGDITQISEAVLVTEDVESMHIPCIELRKDHNNIMELLSDYQRSNVVAVILINTVDTCVLNPAFSDGYEKEKTNTPVLLLSKHSGMDLMSTLKQYKTKRVFAKVDTVFQTSGESDDLMKTTQETGSEHATCIEERGFPQQIARRLHRKPSFDIKGAINKWISSKDPIIFSEDHESFCAVMLAFNTYENAVKSKFHSDVKEVLTKLEKHLKFVFPVDFLFYILLAYRLHKGGPIYECKERELFQKSCIVRMEDLSRQHLTRIFIAFVQRGDFEIVFRDNTPSKVFELLEKACIEMAHVSWQMRKATVAMQLVHQTEFLHGRMMWVSLVLRLRSERGSFDRVATNMWMMKLLKVFPESIVLNKEVCCTLNEELEFGRMLNLPHQLTFDWNHLAHLVTGSLRSCRSFQEVKNCIVEVKEAISTGLELSGFTTHVRCAYDTWLKQDADKLLQIYKDQTTLSGILKEGFFFLDELHKLMAQFHSQEISHEISIQSELLKWLELLLKLIDFTRDDAISLLKMFVTSENRNEVCRKYQKQIKKYVTDDVEANSENLTVEQFFPVLKEFKFWSTKTLETFLKSCKILPQTRMNGRAWTNFMNYLVEKYDDHMCILKFLKRLADHYIEEKCAEEFVFDLVLLDVPKLFVVKPKKEAEPDDDIVAQFNTFLCDYVKRIPIQQKSLLLQRLPIIIDSILEGQNIFQELVLKIVQEEIMYLPEAVTEEETESPAMEHLTTALSLIAAPLCEEGSWHHDLTMKQTFCWGLIASCCSKIMESVTIYNFEWLSYVNVIGKVGYIFTSLPRSLSSEVIECHFGLEKLSKCIRHICDVLEVWKKKLSRKNNTYDELLLYDCKIKLLLKLEEHLSCSSLVIKENALKELKSDALADFERLNGLLLKYIPGQPDAKWCPLPSLLGEYEITLPSYISKQLSKYIVFPNETRKLPVQKIHLVSTKGFFQPIQDISLQLASGMRMDALSQIVHALKKFLEPLKHIDMLVFFKLQRSVMFETYVKHYIKMAKEITHVTSLHTDRPISTADMDQDCAEVRCLEKSIICTKNLLYEIINGTAKYLDINADGELDLSILDIDRELFTLVEFTLFSKLASADHTAIYGIRSLLEVFRYATHIKNVIQVCELYELEGCKEDHNYEVLCDLSKLLESDEYRSQLTAKEAIDIMTTIKQILCIKDNTSLASLDLFSAMRDSFEFYKFVTGNDFVGPEGQSRFYELRQLINAQLQHEEYNETVLHHLYVAFRYIVPFTDKKQNLEQLMLNVITLEATNCIKQLNTVNSNITIIQLWFSRAEGDTIENVNKTLNSVIRTGIYIYSFCPFDGKAEILLKYCASFKHSRSSSERALAEQHLPLQSVLDDDDETETPNQKWTSEQIYDFVRKLGFLDTDEAKHKAFLHVNEVAYRLLDLYACLRELGHPTYLKEHFNETLHCGASHSEADDKVNAANQQLTAWQSTVVSLHSQYDWLRFFSVKKLVILHKLLVSDDTLELIDRIANEVSFLCNNKTTTHALRARIHKLPFPCEKDSPMEVVGDFLGKLFACHDLSYCSEEKLYHERRRIPSFSSSAHNATLHICHTQSDVMQVVFGIYNGVPKPFEVLRCCATTTEEELRMFLSRVSKHPLTYLILEVNKLSCKLQEILIHFNLMSREPTPSDKDHTVSSSSTSLSPWIHFIETAPSLLREIPTIVQEEHKEPPEGFEITLQTWQQKLCKPEYLLSIKLVYGSAGDGKTYYIKQQLASSPASVTIAVNEAFTPLTAIEKLRSLPVTQENCAVFFNFTILPPEESLLTSKDSEEVNYRRQYMRLMETIKWFFFDLFILGYVEDRDTGLSYRIPCGLRWAVYIEVPSLKHSINAVEGLKLLKKEVPVLALLATDYYICPHTPYSVDEDVKLVCKYLRAHKKGGSEGIDRLHSDQVKKFSSEDIADMECQSLLTEYMPEHIRSSKITQRLFVKYMKRRCAFLEEMPAFYLNAGVGEKTIKKGFTNTKELGSTLMNAMLKEVRDLCDPATKYKWDIKPHQQLIYDFKDKGGSIGLITLSPDKISDEDRNNFKEIGVDIPPTVELYDRKLLDSYLSRALNVELENDRLTPIDESNYVLTIDYTVKMLNIHERYKCGVPVIIEGETGVGKTALVEMLSKLWNHSLLNDWKTQKGRLMDFLQKFLGDTATDVSENYPACVKTVQAMSCGDHVNREDLLVLCQLPDSNKKQLYIQLQKYLQPMRSATFLSLLTLNDAHSKQGISLEDLFSAIVSAEATADLLYAMLTAEVKCTFHKINVHAALTPSDIAFLLKPAFDQAKSINKSSQVQAEVATMKESVVQSKETVFTSPTVPFVTIFLDEVNTSSCLGLFKEIILDSTFDGEPIPDNVFIVAACNPHRGNSTATLAKKGEEEAWMRGTYYVRRLHPTLHFLKWDYGALNTIQERDFISAKMQMVAQKAPISKVAVLANIIVKCQDLMRDYAKEHLLQFNAQDAAASSRSCVSQRDIQRVFTLYQWFMSTYNNLKPHGEDCDYSRRAVLVSIGIVYYMRLNSKFRKRFTDCLKEECLPGDITFMKAFNDELNWYIEKVILPTGIAHTQALKENLFATIICCVNHIPLIIVGAPGSSKTLSFNQAIANLQGQESKVALFRKTDVFPSLDPQYYQCSRRTTSNEVSAVFSIAINRQRSHRRYKLPINCVVFMDEAGLPEESHESLKVLHYHLDKQEVSFVAITNHILDAAKTNRAISLFRPESPDEDLVTLAKGCFGSNVLFEPVSSLNAIEQFCIPYSKLMTNPMFRSLFGLRDFIHFVGYLRRKRLSQGIAVTPQTVTEALERNFSGSESLFSEICGNFLEVVNSNPTQVEQRGILEILKESLSDRPQSYKSKQEYQSPGLKPEIESQSEVRYKLIIDSSEDNSIVRFLFSFGILQNEQEAKDKKIHTFVCSDFPGDRDSQVQKINTIAAIRHSAIEGHTVVMSQTDDIHESFYDLFNQRFRVINDPKYGTRYFTNIAIGAHSKLSRVHPHFQCVVVLKESEVQNSPAPFLNRFEKYYISHSILLKTVLNHLPYYLRAIVKRSIGKATEFVQCISAEKSLYGFRTETLESLLLSILPFDHVYKPHTERPSVDGKQDIQAYLITEIQQTLRQCAGFNVETCSPEELSRDTIDVFSQIIKNPEFDGLLRGLDHTKAFLSVCKAMEFLHKQSEPQEHQQVPVSSDVCMVIAVFQQWLVQYLCKKLMQLMTPEALTLHRDKIPSSYLEHYLVHQSHFSLKDVILAHLTTLQKYQGDHTNSPTKLLCFTRSSPLVHQLPNIYYPHTEFDTSSVGCTNWVLQDMVYANTTGLVICKLSSMVSQSFMQELLKTFASSDREVCLLVVNMQETSKRVVNHIRIMIEEIEESYPAANKLYVLLLHFPPVQLFDHCYPSLFLRSWDHYYLDTLSHKAVRGVVDIQDWFMQCCFPKLAYDTDESDSLLVSLKEVLPQSVPILTSRVNFGSEVGLSFNCPMNTFQRSQALRRLLFDLGVGDVLCALFRAYWTHSQMVTVLDRSAKMCSKNSEVTLTITDSIQTDFKLQFFDFLAYMLSATNENCNLDLLFDKDSTKAVKDMFIRLLSIFPTPELSKVSDLSTNLSTPVALSYKPRFPFFQMVCNAMEIIVERSQNPDGSVLSEPTAGNLQPSLIDELQSNATKELQQKKATKAKGPVLMAIEGMEDHDELWQHYYSDYTRHKLHITSAGIAQQLFDACFGSLEQQKPMARIVGLHCHVFVHLLELSKLATILRPLDEIQRMHQHATAEQSSLQSQSEPPSKPSQAMTRGTSFPLNDLAIYVIKALFSTLATWRDGSLSSPMLKQWFDAYRDTLSIPNLMEGIYRAINSVDSTELFEVQLNLMHVTFLVLQSSRTCVFDDKLLPLGYSLFVLLYNRNFNQDMQLKPNFVPPRLSNMAQIVFDVVAPTHSDNIVQKILEGLLCHFFCVERQSYNTADVTWFLEQANIGVEPKQSTLPGRLAESLCSEIGQRFDTVQHSEGKIKVLINVTENVVKLHMMQILLHNTKKENDNPLGLCNDTRLQVGMILCSTPNLGDPGPYIPIFYKNCQCPRLFSRRSKNRLMQQPLAHLYFLTVLEHLMSAQYRLAGLVVMATSIEDTIKCCDVNSVKVVLFVELQAVLQVVAQYLAVIVEPSEMGDVQILVQDINRLFSSEAICGGNVQGYGMVVALHMIKLLKSTRMFSEFMKKQCSIVCKGIHCLEHSKDLLESAGPKPHLFPLHTELAGKMWRQLYNRLKDAMNRIHKEKDPKLLTELVWIANDCDQFRERKQQEVFRMLVWLVAYYEFYHEKIPSKMLKDSIGNTKIASRLRGPCYVQLVQAFLDPSIMINKPEPPASLKDREQAPITSAPPEGVDLLYQLFVPRDIEKQDQSTVDLRHSLANLVAVVLGCPSHSNHLWYHMFKPEELKQTYLTGFLYDSMTEPKLPYDCQVELTSDGLLGRQDYNEHANRGTYNLHSLYFLLWANFGSFCISLLTQPEAEAQLHGPIISKDVPVRHYCVSQLKEVWRHMRDSLGLSEEERSFFVMKIMSRLYELLIGNKIKMKGVFRTANELGEYESLWHEEIYRHTLSDFQKNYMQYSKRWLSNPLMELKQLENCYPYFPQECDCVQNVVAHADLMQPSSTGETAWLLSKFVAEWRHLQVGGSLLPKVVEFYVWIHTNLAYLVTDEKARSLPLGKVVEIASKRYRGNHPSSLYEQIKEEYRNYFTLTGGVRSRGRDDASTKVTVEDDIPLLRFLSVEEQGNDWLLMIIEDIISTHNAFIGSIYSSIQAQQAHPFARLLSDKPMEILLTEVNQYTCIVSDLKSPHGVNKVVQMIRSRYEPHQTFQHGQVLPPQHMRQCPMFEMTELQEDVVVNFVAGKPLIGSSKFLYKPFRFLQTHVTSVTNIVSSGLEDLKLKFPQEFQVTLENSFGKRIEWEFHSASHNTIVGVCTALKTVIGYLIKSLKEQTPGSQSHIEMQTMSQFMNEFHKQEIQNLMKEMGNDNLTSSQVQCLRNLPLKFVWSSLMMFTVWIEEGVYEFCNLSFSLKTHMSSNDKLFIENELREYWFGTPLELLNAVKLMRDHLMSSENGISEKVSKAPAADFVMKPIKVYLQESSYSHDENQDLLVQIPCSILLQHYMYFRLTLKSLRQKLESELQLEVGGEQQQWHEAVDGLWNDVLPNCRPSVTSGAYRCEADYGFPNIPSCRSEHNELSDDIMNTKNEEYCQPSELESTLEDEDVVSLEERAMQYTPDMIAEFLNGIGMADYTHSFLENGIDGELLLDTDEDTLKDLGVLSVIDRLKLKVLFKRHILQSGTVEHPVSEVVKCLEKDSSMSKYRMIFEKNDIDGDMILLSEKDKLFDELMKEIGVTEAVIRLKLQFLFRRNLQNESVMYPVWVVVQVLENNRLGNYKVAFEDNLIDGDMILEADNHLFNEVMQEIGVGPGDRMKIKKYFKKYVSVK